MVFFEEGKFFKKFIVIEDLVLVELFNWLSCQILLIFTKFMLVKGLNLVSIFAKNMLLFAYLRFCIFSELVGFSLRKTPI
jgi:hypothetical protein